MTGTARIKDERGITTIVALIVMVVALLLAAAVVGATVAESVGSRRDTAEKRAFEAAQAGLQQSLYRFNMLVNTQSGLQPSALYGYCMGASSSGVEAILQPSAVYNNHDCAPYTESLGNGAFYTSWTSIAYNSGTLTCAGTSIAVTNFLGERCFTSEGIICPPSYTTVTQGQLPCPNPVLHRVEERVSANTGKGVFTFAGITAPNGIWIQNNTTINGTINTNGELYISGNATVSQGENLKQGGPWPQILNNNATLASCSGKNYPPGTTNWPTSCVNPVATTFSIPTVQYPYTNCTGNATDTTCPNGSGSWNYLLPDGDQYISNAFLPCSQGPTPSCTADQFVGCNSASSCGWNAQNRTLVVPNGVTWQLKGSTYDLCTLQLNGSATAKLTAGLRTALYIDSPLDKTPSGPTCPSGTGAFVLGNQSQFINNTPGSVPGIAFDTKALQIYIYGTSTLDPTKVTYNQNDCINPPDAACVQLGQSTNFYGTVTAPNSDILMANSAATYGAVQGRTVTYANTGSFNTDLTDTSILTPSLGVYYRTLWHDCAVPFAPATDPTSNC